MIACVVVASRCKESVVDAAIGVKAPNLCDAGCAAGASVKVVQCGVGTGSAGVSCLVVSGAESDVAGGVHWCVVVVGCAVVCVVVGCSGRWWCCLFV